VAPLPGVASPVANGFVNNAQSVDLVTYFYVIVSTLLGAEDLQLYVVRLDGNLSVCIAFLVAFGVASNVPHTRVLPFVSFVIWFSSYLCGRYGSHFIGLVSGMHRPGHVVPCFGITLIIVLYLFHVVNFFSVFIPCVFFAFGRTDELRLPQFRRVSLWPGVVGMFTVLAVVNYFTGETKVQYQFGKVK
jgi:hypothetical protein